MNGFRAGQLVAVRNGSCDDWTLAYYDHTCSSGRHICGNITAGTTSFTLWNQVVPAEEVWPDFFFARDLVSRDWLVERLAAASKTHGFCPPNRPQGECGHDCETCWRWASYEEAMKEDAHA